MKKKKNRWPFLILFASILINQKVYSLNAFELSLLGIGAGFLGIQYFDSSLDQENSYKQKISVINKFDSYKQKSIQSVNFYDLPIQQQLLIINEFDKY